MPARTDLLDDVPDAQLARLLEDPENLVLVVGADDFKALTGFDKECRLVIFRDIGLLFLPRRSWSGERAIEAVEQTRRRAPGERDEIFWMGDYLLAPSPKVPEALMVEEMGIVVRALLGLDVVPIVPEVVESKTTLWLDEGKLYVKDGHRRTLP